MESPSPIAEATSLVCMTCMRSNLTEEIRIQKCERCTKIYCVHFASNIDPRFCTNCLSDISMSKETIRKTYINELYDEESDTVVTKEYTRRAQLVKLAGFDWLFYQRKIFSMSDDALELAQEFHREILNAIIAEREDRKAKFMHRYAGVRVASNASAAGQVNVNTTTEVKKTRTISSTKLAANANAMLQSMLATGMSLEQILAKIDEMQKGIKI